MDDYQHYFSVQLVHSTRSRPNCCSLDHSRHRNFNLFRTIVPSVHAVCRSTRKDRPTKRTEPFSRAQSDYVKSSRDYFLYPDRSTTGSNRSWGTLPSVRPRGRAVPVLVLVLILVVHLLHLRHFVNKPTHSAAFLTRGVEPSGGGALSLSRQQAVTTRAGRRGTRLYVINSQTLF